MGLCCGFQMVPSHFKMVPASPTIQTLSASLPQTPFRLTAAGLCCALQLAPSQRKSVPASPTAQALLAPLPHTPYSALPVTGEPSLHQPSGLQPGRADGVLLWQRLSASSHSAPAGQRPAGSEQPLSHSPEAPEAPSILFNADRVQAIMEFGRDYIGFGLYLLRNPD